MDWLRLCQSSPVPSSAPHTSLFTAIDRATSRDMQPITNVFLSGSCFSVVYYIYVTYRHIQLQANSRPSIDYRNNFRKHFVSCFSILAPSLHIQILDLSYCALLSNKPFMVNFSYLVTGEKKKKIAILLCLRMPLLSRTCLCWTIEIFLALQFFNLYYLLLTLLLMTLHHPSWISVFNDTLKWYWDASLMLTTNECLPREHAEKHE